MHGMHFFIHRRAYATARCGGISAIVRYNLRIYGCYELQPKINSVLAVIILLRIDARYDAKVVVIHNFVSVFLSRKTLSPLSTYVSVSIRVRTAPTREGLITLQKRMRIRELKDLK